MSDIQRLFSPDGRFFIQFNSYEMRMSHWLNKAMLWEAAPERLLLLLGDSLWSTERARWRDDSIYMTAELRRYPGDVPAIRIDVYPGQRLITLHLASGETLITFEDLDRYLEQYYRQHSRISPSG